jgi:hypothetical protein
MWPHTGLSAWPRRYSPAETARLTQTAHGDGFGYARVVASPRPLELHACWRPPPGRRNSLVRSARS